MKESRAIPPRTASEIVRCVDACVCHKRPVYIEVPHDMVDREIPVNVIATGAPPESDFHALEAALEETLTLIFFEGEWKNANIYNYGLIIVENSDEDVQVTFYLTDAHEMNWVTEFLDAPFFTRTETEKLFGLTSAHPDSRSEKVGRYRVEFHHWHPRHADIFVFSFTPA